MSNNSILSCIRYCSNRYCRTAHYCVCSPWRHWSIWYLYQAVQSKHNEKHYLWMRVLGGLWIRWSAFFPIKSVVPLISPKHLRPSCHLAERKKLLKSVLQNLCYTWNISTIFQHTLSQFPSWYELLPYFSKQTQILKHFFNRRHLEISDFCRKQFL